MYYIKRILFVLFVIFFSIPYSYSQARSSGVTFKRNDDKSVTFYYFKDKPGSVFVVLKFNELTNASEGVVRTTISGYEGRLVTLNPLDKNKSIGFSYSFRAFKGNAAAKPDFQFKYILPFKNDKEVVVRNLNYLGKKFGNSEPKNWKSFQFLAKPEDTVFAARKGIVVNIRDEFDADDEAEYGFRNKANSIIIEHDDGTLANYSVLKKNSFMVKLGDVVYPYTPLAICGTYDTEENSQLRFTVHYLDESIADYNIEGREKEKFSNRKHYYAYVNPLFYANSNEVLKLEGNATYRAMCNDAIIELEMSKREKKKWKK